MKPRKGCGDCLRIGRACENCLGFEALNPEMVHKPVLLNKASSTLADLYPQYHKLIPPTWVTLDTYGVNILFPIEDASGILIHARKKLLVPGVRTGGKSMRKDILEARDQLNRWLELNPE